MGLKFWKKDFIQEDRNKLMTLRYYQQKVHTIHVFTTKVMKALFLGVEFECVEDM